MNALKKRIKNFFRKPKKYATLNFPTWVNTRGVFPGVLKGGVVRVEVVDETEKALEIHYFRQYIPCMFGIDPRLQEYCEWVLRTDNRIVEVYER